jgi:hypothetical protein
VFAKLQTNFSILAYLFAIIKMAESTSFSPKENTTLINELNIHWVWPVLAMGIGATLAIDLWSTFLKRSFGIMPTNWAIVGRWFAGIPQGRFSLQSGSGMNPVRYELQLGWIAHYAVGICYALVYVTILRIASTQVSLSTALAFGLVTVLAPWLVLMPGLGKGWFAAATPKPALTRLLNIVVHLIFGAGLYVMWCIYITTGI